LARRGWGWRYRLLHARRHGRLDLARVSGMALLVPPGVFHPEFFFATRFFVRYLARRAVTPMMRGTRLRVLDVGTGSGALALFLARRGAEIVAIDINPEAVCAARCNAVLHGVGEWVRVLEGDLFAGLGGEQFDLILFNPPFYERPARDMADRAWTGGPGNVTLRRFLTEAPAHLAPGGELLVCGSTEAPYTTWLARAPGYRVRLVARCERISEQLFLFALRVNDYVPREA